MAKRISLIAAGSSACLAKKVTTPEVALVGSDKYSYPKADCKAGSLIKLSKPPVR